MSGWRLPEETQVNGEELMKFAMVFFVFGGAFWTVRPLFAAAARRLEVPKAKAAEDDSEVLAQLQELRAEVADLAERVDFAERLLAKQREAARLAPPG